MSDNNEVQKRSSGIPGMFEGPVLPLLIRLALPMLTGMVFQLLYNLTDTFWISRIDPADPSYFGGTGLVFPIIFFAIAIANGLMVGTSSLVARAIGSEDNNTLNSAAESGLAIAGILAVLVMTAGYLFTDSIITLLGAEGSYFTHAKEYLTYILPGVAVMFIGNTLFGVLQGEGLMKRVMTAMIIGTVANIVLDPVFIFVLKMEVRGAALATVIAQTFSVIWVVSVFLRKKTRVPIQLKKGQVKPEVVAGIVSIGLPQALGQIIMSMSFLILNRVVISIDPLFLTSFALVGRFDQAVLMPIFAIGSALVTMAGQNTGRGLYSRVRRIWYTSLGAAVVVVIGTATLMILASPFIYPVFTDIPTVVEYAVLQTRVMEYTFIFAVVGILGRSVFQAVGNPIPALILVLLRLVVIAIPAVLIYVYIFDLGIFGVFGGLITGNFSTAIVSLLIVERMLKKLKQREHFPEIQAEPEKQ